MPKNIPLYIQVNGLLLKRVDAPPEAAALPQPNQMIWHLLVYGRFSGALKYDALGKDREDLLASYEDAAQALQMHHGYRASFEPSLERLSIDDVKEYLDEASRSPKRALSMLAAGEVVVLLNDLTEDVHTAASPKQGFTLEDAERIASDIGMDLATVPWDAEQFRMGLDVELEHGKKHSETNVTNDDPLATGKIAWAHLMEIPDYYNRLANMEKSGKQAQEDGVDQPSSARVVKVEDKMTDQPKYVRVNGHLYQLAPDQVPEYIRVQGKVYRKASPEQLQVMAKKKGGGVKLPRGWTRESAKEWWGTMMQDKPEHPVTHCIRQLSGKEDIDDPGAFCAWMADLAKGTEWRHEPRKRSKKSKEARVDYMLPKGHPQLPMGYNVPVRLGKNVAAYLQSLNRGQGDPVYALSSRLFAYGATLASVEELEYALDAVREDQGPRWLIEELEDILAGAGGYAGRQ